MPLSNPLEDFPDEAPLGYYRRLAQENRFAGWQELARAVDISVSPSGLMANPAHLARSLGLDERWTKRVAKRDITIRDCHRYLRTQYDAVCPHCLKEAEYIRVDWEHVFVVACHHHKTLLIDHCPQCNEPLSKSRSRIGFCERGHDLRAFKPEQAEDALIWVAQALGHADTRGPWPGPKLRGFPLPALSDIINTLCTFHDPSSKGVRRNATQRRWIGDAVNHLGALTPLLQDWPAGFKAHVQTRLLAADPAARTLNAALGIWYQRLKRASLPHANEPFLQETIGVVTSHAPSLLGLDGASGKLPGTPQMFNLRDAAERLGLRRDNLAAAIEKGSVAARTRSLGTRRLMYQIEEAEVLRLEEVRRGWIDEAQARELLDVPEATLDGLKAAGAIVFDLQWRSNVGKRGPIQIQSVSGLLERIRSSVDRTSAYGDSLALREISSRRVRDKQELGRLYRAISNGEIRGVGRLPATGIGDVRFRREDLALFTGNPVLEAGLTIERLGELTGWKYESISHWIAVGLLECREIVLRGQKCKVVMPEQIVAFMRHYVPLADAAKLIGTTASGLSRRMTSIQLLGAKSVSASTSRGGLIPLAELVRFSVTAGKP